MTNGSRVCPICEQMTDETMCPTDQVPTVDQAMLDRQRADRFPPGTMVAGRYQLEGFLGSGAMGAVYLCTQVNMQRPVALKTLKPELMSNPDMLKRFYLEARAASQLDHPNIVRIYDFGIDEAIEIAYIAMEFLPGFSLREFLVERKMFPEAEACGMVAQIAKALVNAHEHGIIHRDLKPGNIHVRQLPEGDVHCKVLDFGIAKVLHGTTDSMANLTRTGTAMGTALYMPPEQIRGVSLDFRADLYSLGCLLFELVQGEVPYPGTDVAVLFRHLNDPIPDLAETMVDGTPPTDGFRRLVRSLLSKDPDGRPGSTSGVAKALHALGRGIELATENFSEWELDAAATIELTDFNRRDTTQVATNPSMLRESVVEGPQGAETGPVVQPPAAGEGDAAIPEPPGTRDSVDPAEDEDTLIGAAPLTEPVPTAPTTQVGAEGRSVNVSLLVVAGMFTAIALVAVALYLDYREQLVASHQAVDSVELTRRSGQRQQRAQQMPQAIRGKDGDPMRMLIDEAQPKPKPGSSSKGKAFLSDAGVRVASIKVLGELQEKQARDVLLPVSDLLTGCFARTMSGRAAKRDISLSIAVLHNGWVGSVSVKPNTSDTVLFKACVSKDVKKLRFPKASGPGLSSIDIRIVP